MKWVVDSTGRFPFRPYYERAELDNECEKLVVSFLRQRHGESSFPISTDDLTVMIEQDTSALDLYADLSAEGLDVEGLTDFFPYKKPVVKISREVSLDEEKPERLRTTLAHEYGHVKFHTFLWDIGYEKKPAVDMGKKIAAQRRKIECLRAKFANKSSFEKGHQPSPVFSTDRFFINTDSETGPRCNLSTEADSPGSDWMEWQAGYISGAILMPLAVLRNLVRSSLGKWNISDWLFADSEYAGELVKRVVGAFDVSAEGARVRLLQLGFLQQIQSEEAPRPETALSHLSG